MCQQGRAQNNSNGKKRCQKNWLTKQKKS